MKAIAAKLESTLAEWTGDAVLPHVLLKLVAIALLCLVFAAAWWSIHRLSLYLDRKLEEWRGTRIRSLRIQRQHILTAGDITRLLRGANTWLRRGAKLLLLLLFVNYVFVFFTWSRDAAIRMIERRLMVIGDLAVALFDYLPDLLVVIVVILLARLALHLVRIVFDGIQAERIRVHGFYPEWARTTFNLLRILVIGLTVVVVFPYLPGSDSPAFRALSIFFGVLLSLGSSSAVANVIAGIVLTYTRAFRRGHWVKIAETEGEIVERTAFVTRVRTSKNVEVSIPNSSVLGHHVINYSSQAKGAGLMLNTSVTIGYDVPWPQVHELLLEAAARTERIERDPAPFVLQTALGDFYVEYELNVTTREPERRPRIFSDLHANILDAFHEAGVEIMSPHYRANRDGSAIAIPSKG